MEQGRLEQVQAEARGVDAVREVKAADGWAAIAPVQGRRVTVSVRTAGSDSPTLWAHRATREVALNVGPRWRANKTAIGPSSEEIVEGDS